MSPRFIVVGGRLRNLADIVNAVEQGLGEPILSPDPSRNLYAIDFAFSIDPFSRPGLAEPDSGVEPKQDLDSLAEVAPIQDGPGPCDTCRAGLAIMAYKLFLFLVAVLSSGKRGRDRHPYISRVSQIDVQCLRDALAELYDFVKMMNRVSDANPGHVQLTGLPGIIETSPRAVSRANYWVPSNGVKYATSSTAGTNSHMALRTCASAWSFPGRLITCHTDYAMTEASYLTWN